MLTTACKNNNKNGQKCSTVMLTTACRITKEQLMDGSVSVQTLVATDADKLHCCTAGAYPALAGVCTFVCSACGLCAETFAVDTAPFAPASLGHTWLSIQTNLQLPTCRKQYGQHYGLHYLQMNYWFECFTACNKIYSSCLQLIHIMS